MKNFAGPHFLPLLLMFSLSVVAQKTELVVDVSHSISEIQPTMYGIFFEDINYAADGGIYAEMVKNRGFEFDNPMMGWLQPSTNPYGFNPRSGIGTIIKSNADAANRNFLRATIENDKGYELVNEGFWGMGIQRNALYRFSMMARNTNQAIKKINVQMVDSLGQVLANGSIAPTDKDWETYTTTLVGTETNKKATLKFTFEGSGVLDLDNISLFPEDTWKGRKNGLRKDIVQLLADMQPGFLRFPGGCIVEGRTLTQRYQWKKTVGPVWDRTLLINRWNTEFAHRPAPDYFQSFGLGFFEYFQLSEDLGAEPLPILGCGMACQFNTGELVPLDDLGPYIQDALDLIEFANGSIESAWGKVRSDMGHPEPFHMKYIGIGNEQWGPQYIERYKLFEKALKEKYPEIIIISSSGPFPEGDYFDYGSSELKKLGTEIIDEHYYNSPEWFRNNATRYDGYDRIGPKIFAGEYAGQSVGTTSPENKNNWECALSEAAFMTGLERNADVVVMTSYAPLLAHEEGWQWTPDLIWFNNLKTYGTVNYYVQKLFATHRGTHLLAINTPDGKVLAGQKDLYASAVKDAGTGETYIKLVNTSNTKQDLKIAFKNVKLSKVATVLTMRSDDLADENSFDNPKKIIPKEHQLPVANNQLNLDLPPYTLMVMKIGAK
nr:alpha-L-arabinofuranosidase gene [uncultured bacterium]